MNENELKRLLLDTGDLMIKSGAETFRVEETIEIIGRSLGLKVRCYVTLTAIFISINDEDYLFQKTQFNSNNLRVIDDINSLSRQLSEKTMSKIVFIQALQTVLSDTKKGYPFPLQILGAGMVSVTPILIFNVSYLGLFLCFITGIVSFTCCKFIGNRSKIPYVNYALSGFFIGSIACLLNAMHFTEYGSVLIGSIMPLVPGVAITSSIRELIMRHYLSGAVRLLDAAITSASIGLGIFVAFSIFI